MKLIVGQKYECKALEIKSYGAVMELPDGSTQLLHISNIADDYVKDVAHHITVGETYELTAIQGKVKAVELSLKDEPDDSIDMDSMNFEQLLEYYPPTTEDLRSKRDRSKKRR